MANDFFRFKQFAVKQSGAAMKVGVDSVLLGSWAYSLTLSEPVRVLDIGTGTGLLALMIAQRFSRVMIDAIEIDAEACNQAIQNVKDSPWAERIHILCEDFCDFAKQTSLQYDFLICNPPYFTASLKSPDNRRSTARHNDCLPHVSIISGAAKLLAPNGILAIVLPPAEAEIMISSASLHYLFVHRVLYLKSNPEKPISRMLVEFSRKEGIKDKQFLCIEQSPNHFSTEYRDLTKDFYLKF